MRSPRFRTKDVSTCLGSPTARGSSPASQLHREDVAFSSAERDRHLGIRPVSQLNSQPVVSPVNASRRPSRDAAHHSGPGRLAKPYPVEDLHLLSFASLSWRTPRWVRLGPFMMSDQCPDCRRKQTPGTSSPQHHSGSLPCADPSHIWHRRPDAERAPWCLRDWKAEGWIQCRAVPWLRNIASRPFDVEALKCVNL